ncbi:TadE/TadG family type IV pilus assembly protein [Aureimonas phyllosphaerae]|uniref:Flp pilus assembly protein TadG n=1 Tax=Aureimonas phyllosphaerae TaxID=1166078 RepID=A0A7W6FSZ0_9HYPH|nr:TadE/TadG family type IV pilus assembly protein [Aureimonas phyllosphaerae]MBB3934441.1 Flp pilus assembly protein TadG [Aureimonas phyllosphaerae]MBB3958343.1 Flp pilus assembly protein TadG [Aureimonas phyllosphaerae]SFE95615.1 TadE-like protein [Aureimonas phyllosphaerae]
MRHLGLLHDIKGSSAVEFAMVVPIFLALVFSTLEGGWMMTRSILLSRALDETVRLIRVGDPSAPKDHATMKKALCARTLIVRDCEHTILIEMKEIKLAADVPTTAAKCVDRAATVQPTTNFSTGSRGSIMYVRACIVSDPIVPLMGLVLKFEKDGKGGYHQTAVSTFMNEPGA